MARITVSQSLIDPNGLAAGESTIPRIVASSVTNVASGQIRLAYFTATKTQTAAALRMLTSGTAASATPTICRAAVYEVALNGDLTRAGVIANDPTLFAAANTAYTRTLQAPFTMMNGRRYAFGLLVVTATTAPSFPAAVIQTNSSELTQDPRLSGVVLAQSDLPSNIPSGSLAAASSVIYAAVLP